MLQLPQSSAWLQEAPEPPVVVIDRWITVVPANISPADSNPIIAARTAILVIERILPISLPPRRHGSLRRLFRRS